MNHPTEKRRHPYLDKILRYAPFEWHEFRAFMFLSFLYAFILSFDDWGKYAFSFWTGIGNLILSIAVVLLSHGAHHYAQRWYSAHRGYKPEHTIWIPGIIIALALMLITNGTIMMFAATGIFIQHLAVQRLGTFRYGENVKVLGPIALMGLLATGVLAAIARILLDSITWTPVTTYILTQLWIFNITYLIWNILPIPPLDGSRIFFWSRLQYVFWIAGIGGYFLILLFTGISSILIALITALIILTLYYYFYEQYFWNPMGVSDKESFMNKERKKKLGL